MTEHNRVFAEPDGLHYVAYRGDALGWVRWPAVEHGWAARKGCSATLADACFELPADLARLALRLSGVEGDA